jgi:outer membrane protein assembly factor BamB
MIRIHTGRAWRQDPRLLSQLRTATGGRALARAAIVDTVGIEVDGVDLAAGIEEDSVLEVTSELVVAVAALAAGRSRSLAAFPAAGVHLVLTRRGRLAQLSFVRQRRPAGAATHGVEVELEALCRAALDCGRTFLSELGAINPALVATLPARRLARATQRLAGRAAPARPGRAAEPFHAPAVRAATEGLPCCAFDFEDDEGILETFRGGQPDLQSLLVRGRMSLRLTRQTAEWSGEGYLFLMLREQTASALALVRALEAGEIEHLLPLCDGGSLLLDLEAGRAGLPGKRLAPCDPIALARCLFEASRLFVRVAVGRNPRLKDNGHLVELRRSAQEGLARCDELATPPPPARRKLKSPRARRPAQEPPLAPGRLRRLSYRKLWSAKIPTPTGLCLSGGTVIVLSEEGTLGLSARDGAPRWRGPAGPGLAVALPGGDAVVAAGRRLVRFGADGRPAWSVALLATGSPAASLRLSFDGRQAMLASATEVVACLLDSGRPLWRFTPPGCSALTVASAPGLSIVAASDGRLYGVDPIEGRLRWRVRTGAKLAGPAFAWEGFAVALSQRPEGCGLHLIGLADGKAIPAASPQLARPGACCVTSTQLILAGTVGGDGAVVAYATSGQPQWRWQDKKLGPGMPQLCASPEGVVVRGSRATVCLDATGRLRWERLFDEELHGGPPPCLRRGVLLLAAERSVLGLDPATGQLLGQAGEDEPLWPAFLAVDDALTLFSAEEDGPLEAYGLGTFLSVL